MGVIGFEISRLGTSVGKTLKDGRKKDGKGASAEVYSHCGKSKRNCRKVGNEGK